jgi:putative heme-binding domain-containing protein
MRILHLLNRCLLIALVTISINGIDFQRLYADEPEFQNLFNGKDLDGWKGTESLWSVEDGTIVGQTTEKAPIAKNTFLVWQGGAVADFEFRCEVKFKGVNSGVQYRSAMVNEKNFALSGYQADLHPRADYMGMMYSERTGRGIIATGGTRVVVPAEGKPETIASLVRLKKPVATDWNELRIVAVGNRMIHQLNGVTVVDVTDNHPDASEDGLLGLQLHRGGPMKAEFRALKLRKLVGGDAENTMADAIAATQTVTLEKAKKRSDAKEKKPAGSKEDDLGIVALPDFIVEKVYSVPKDQGSWVSLCVDPKGRFYACDQADAGLFRLTLRGEQPPLVEKISTGALEGLSGAQGLHWAFDSLWFHRNGGNLIRLTDADGDDMLDTAETIPGGQGSGEHGNHAVLTTEDGAALYLGGGNHAPLGETTANRVPTWYEGLLLPRMWDARGHARGRMAPGGWVTRLNIETKEQSAYSIGYRNQYDIALNRHGDLFAYDADMEWDMGMPWYRPPRICFAASGSDYGWRSGSGKWPTYYEDSLPPVVEIGPGSPTGLISGANAAFPTKYKDAIFALDWTFGTMYAIHLVPDGSGYRGEAEQFLYGTPLPMVDAEIGMDGAMYFTAGGRGAESSLYRVRYTGEQSQEAPTEVNPDCVAARKQRRSLESFHGVISPEAVDAAWPILASSDRFLRHAARIAVESQPVQSWAGKVATEQDPQTRITASVALARMGEAKHQSQLVSGLLGLDVAAINESQLLGLLRAYALTFGEIGAPDDEQRAAVIAHLSPLLPSDSFDVNTELVRVLTYLQDETIPRKVTALIEDRSAPVPPQWSELASRSERYGPAVQKMIENHPPSRELMYAFMLRNQRAGWTMETRRAYFQFLNEAAKASGGSSYRGFLTRVRDEALATMTDEQRLALNDVTGEDFNPKPDFPIVAPKGPGQKWTVEKALAAKDELNFEMGRSLYFSASCAACHRLNGLGGAIGPDLTSVRNKFDEKYLVEAIVHPSQHISDQYSSSMVLTDEGEVLTGLVVKQDNGDLLVYPVDENAGSVLVPADSIEMVKESKISQMPEGLLDRLNESEVHNLLMYIMAGGNSKDKVYESVR